MKLNHLQNRSGPRELSEEDHKIAFDQNLSREGFMPSPHTTLIEVVPGKTPGLSL